MSRTGRRLPGVLAASVAAALLLSSCGQIAGSAVRSAGSSSAAPSASSAPPSASSAPPPSTASGNSADGPTLVDDTGRTVPTQHAQLIIAVYRAIQSGDLAALQGLYGGPAGTWPAQRDFLSKAANRTKILHALSTHPANTDGYTYPGFVLSGWMNDTDRADGRKLHVDPDAMPNPSEQFLAVAYATTFAATDEAGTTAWIGIHGPGIDTDAPAHSDGVDPVLGQPFAPYQEGYGTVRPRTISNGGDPSGVVNDVRWTSWGGEQAFADGIGTDDSGGGTVADQAPAPAKVIASDLGTCGGKPAYRKVGWYFPGHGQTAASAVTQDICPGG